MCVLLRPRLQLLGDLHGEDVALAGSPGAGAVLAALALEHPVPQGSSLVSAGTARHAMQMGIMISELNIASQHGDVECTLLSVVVYENISFHIVESRDRIINIYNYI